MSVEPTKPEACAFCAFGAIERVYTNDRESKVKLQQLGASIGSLPIGRWNDRADHATVLAKLKLLDI